MARKLKTKPKLEFKEMNKVLQMKVIFRRATIIPEKSEYFMRLDLVTHQLKIKFQDEVILSPFSSSGLFPEWEFKLNFQLENLDDNLDLTIIRKKGEE